MSLLDVLLVFLGAAGVLWGMYRQLLGTLLSLVGLYFTLLVAGMATSFLSGAYSVGTEIVQSLWGQPTSIRLIEVGLFAALGIGCFVALEVGNRYAFPNPALKGLGILDGVFGGILGLVLGVALMAVFSNLWRLVVLTSWQPYATWLFLRRAYDASLLAPWLKPALQALRTLLFPFALMGYPRVLTP